LNGQLLSNTKADDISAVEPRRKFLKLLAYGSVLALGGCGVETAAVRDWDWEGIAQQSNTRYRHSTGHRALSFEHAHTGEKLKLTYFERGNYIKDALQEIDYLLRDFRTEDIHPIDTALLDQLFDLKQTLALNKPFHILSGYRSPITNARLRKHSHGVAEHSYHMQGMAIDIRVEGISSKTIRNTALAMAQGGVGYYPRNNFVHLDTGRHRSW